MPILIDLLSSSSKLCKITCLLHDILLLLIFNTGMSTTKLPPAIVLSSWKQE